MVIPIRTPGQGRSEVTGSRKMWKASSLGKPQLLFPLWLLAMALKYLACKLPSPPILTKPKMGIGSSYHIDQVHAIIFTLGSLLCMIPVQCPLKSMERL